MDSSDENLKLALDTAGQVLQSARILMRLLTAKNTKGMTLTKLAILGRLYRGGAATATELATYMRIQPQSLTRVLADLEQKKFISRRQNETDRRQSLIEITHLGAATVVKDYLDQRAALAENILKMLTPVELEMLRISAVLIDRLADATDNHKKASP